MRSRPARARLLYSAGLFQKNTMAYTTCTPPAGDKITISRRQAQRPGPIRSSRSSTATAPARTSGRRACACSTRRWRRPTAAAKKIAWMEVFAGETSKTQFDNWLPDDTVEAFKEYLVGIKGPLTTPVGGGIRSLNVALRQMLDLYVCLRPVQYFTGVPSPVKHPEKVDMVIFRENTEDIYAGIEYAGRHAGGAEGARFPRAGISRRSSRRSASAREKAPSTGTRSGIGITAGCRKSASASSRSATRHDAAGQARSSTRSSTSARA